MPYWSFPSLIYTKQRDETIGEDAFSRQRAPYKVHKYLDENQLKKHSVSPSNQLQPFWTAFNPESMPRSRQGVGLTWTILPDAIVFQILFMVTFRALYGSCHQFQALADY